MKPQHTVVGRLLRVELQAHLGSLSTIIITLSQGDHAQVIYALRSYPADQVHKAQRHLSMLLQWRDRQVAATGSTLAPTSQGLYMTGCTDFKYVQADQAADDAAAAAQPASQAWPLPPSTVAFVDARRAA